MIEYVQRCSFFLSFLVLVVFSSCLYWASLLPIVSLILFDTNLKQSLELLLAELHRKFCPILCVQKIKSTFIRNNIAILSAGPSSM